MKLKNLQQEFADYMYSCQTAELFDKIKKEGVSVKRRLQVYHNNIFGSFDDVLNVTYPITKKLVGDQYFQILATKYHQKYRSKTGNLDDYGAYFSTLISSLKKEHKLLYLKDIAKLEWLYHRAYLSSDKKPINLQKLQALKEDDYFKVKFRLHPSCYLVVSNYAIYTIWTENQKESPNKININKKSGEFMLIERYCGETKIHKLSEIEYLFLQNIKKRHNIYQIYEFLTAKNPNFDIGLLINKYVFIGVLSDFELDAVS